MNITVYLGARGPVNPALTIAARELGTWIGANNHQLIYGDPPLWSYGRVG